MIPSSNGFDNNYIRITKAPFSKLSSHMGSAVIYAWLLTLLLLARSYRLLLVLMLERPIEIGLPAEVDVGGIIVGGTRLTYRVIQHHI